MPKSDPNRLEGWYVGMYILQWRGNFKTFDEGFDFQYLRETNVCAESNSWNLFWYFRDSVGSGIGTRRGGNDF